MESSAPLETPAEDDGSYTIPFQPTPAYGQIIITDGGVGNLAGRDRHMGVLAHGVARTGDGAGNDDVVVHVL